MAVDGPALPALPGHAANELVRVDCTRTLSAEQYKALADIPPEAEWLANITNLKTRRFYQRDVSEFVTFAGLKDSSALRTVVRSHVIAWRKDLESRNLSHASIRRKLSSLSSLFDYLCERNAVLGNPVDGVKRPASNNNEGSTPHWAMPRCVVCWRPLPSIR